MCDRRENTGEKQWSRAKSLAESGIHWQLLLGRRESHESMKRNKENGQGGFQNWIPHRENVSTQNNTE
jgi:hypothetical protein